MYVLFGSEKLGVSDQIYTKSQLFYILKHMDFSIFKRLVSKLLFIRASKIILKVFLEQTIIGLIFGTGIVINISRSQ